MTEQSWMPDDPIVDPDDPQAAAREQRRREREARRRQRAAKQPTAKPDQPPTPPRAAAASPEGIPPPERRLPSSAARTPFTQRVAAMRKRLPASRGGRPPNNPGPPQSGGGGGGGFLNSLASHWGRVVAGIVAVLVAWFLISLFQPFHGSGGAPVVVTIPKGASVSEVGDLLDDSGVVSSSLFFQIRATLAGKRSDLLPGTYTLHENESYGDAIDDLTTPPQRRGTVTVTVPEGLSRAQIAPLATQAGLKGSFVKASVRSKFLDPARYGGKRARNLEGFLFPDTYDLKGGTPVADLVQLQLQDFRRRIKAVNMSYARSKNLTTYDVLTIASMIEREVQLPSQRRLVAAVIYNRLRDGMPLGIDATTRFAVDNYTRPLTESQLNSPSPYNTRLHAGLPPGPIGNPGLASIEAAAHPAKVNYLYFVVKPGTCGQLVFSVTTAEAQRRAAAYQRALQAQGHSPTRCPG